MPIVKSITHNFDPSVPQNIVVQSNNLWTLKNVIVSFGTFEFTTPVTSAASIDIIVFDGSNIVIPISIATDTSNTTSKFGPFFYSISDINYSGMFGTLQFQLNSGGVASTSALVQVTLLYVDFSV